MTYTEEEAILAHREQWIEALRSGKYEQAKGILRDVDDNNKFCCLGVACEISGLGEWLFGGIDFSYLDSSKVLPKRSYGLVWFNSS